MNFEEVKELIQTVNSSDISFFELTMNDDHIKMDKSSQREVVKEITNNEVLDVKEEEEEACTYLDVKDEANKEEIIKEELPKDDLVVVKSPMVGTFYSAPYGESADFINVGDRVNKGSVLCVIEAMKLMNEIESEYNGIVKEILVKGGDMVEYGQPLFKIEQD